MKTLPSAVRIAAIAGLALFAISASLVFCETMVRIYSANPTEFTETAGTFAAWGTLVLAGIAFVWRHRLETPATSSASKARGMIALVSGIFCGGFALATIHYGSLRLSVPGETLSIWQSFALSAGLVLAAILSFLRAILELRSR